MIDIYKEAFLIIVAGIVGAFLSTIFKPVLDKDNGIFIFIFILFIVFVLVILSLLVYPILWVKLIA